VASPVTFQLKFGSLGPGNGYLNGPFGIAVDASGNLWVADSLNRRIEEFDLNGNFLQTVSGVFSSPSPYSIAIDIAGDIWAADYNLNEIFDFSSTGLLLFTTGTTGGAPGQLFHPTCLAWGAIL
jgi:DNA-binding beta-propeller fold protein YncE